MTIQLPSSQQVPLPVNLPFRIISKTIGQGAYASIRKAIPLNTSKPVIAIKFINKEHAYAHSRLRPKQIQTELVLHQHLGKHQNIIRYIAHGDDPLWIWIGMELAEGGDLFDKIEADVGVGEDIAHFYFTQLISAVSYMHSKGVAHRDIKPENILLSGEGNLKIADFGLAALFVRDGKKRLCNTVCGSPPYIAPEIVAGKRSKRQDLLETGYAANIADVWSCGVVLFVLLVGNTPWDEPTRRSYEFCEYQDNNGRTTDELWTKIPQDMLSLLRGMLKLDPKGRFTLDEVRTHPWFTRRNPHLSSSGTAANPIVLATQMLESLKIDLNARITPSQLAAASDPDAMDIDSGPALRSRFSSTQPETPVAETIFDWERPPRHPAADGISASQPTYPQTQVSSATLDRLGEDPSFSQFSQTPAVPMSLTQAARHFGDIVPSHSLARFLSPLSFSLLLQLLVEALHRLGIPARAIQEQGREDAWWIRVQTIDGRQQPLSGTVFVERYDGEMLEVRFVKAKGDPLEWRRFFKKVVVLCKDGIMLPS
ncbi:serine/threonine-protein kinase Chk1 [Rhizodiscina lignyota]|uniref:non-specific serine/threonine protein kinase n=1 Tax=Rhizodiscina lignyota TaxID=1504668 RepID=A0A9P4M816_9PEZI|nr:serine/threonine-protein kinase Chk1 [Rhizodiscina lignyota]